MTEQTRKGLGALFALLGAYYCVVGGAVLVQRPSVTSRWIERSGDRDFRLDYDLFLKLSGVGAALILLLGWRTVVRGLATARGQRPSLSPQHPQTTRGLGVAWRGHRIEPRLPDADLARHIVE